MATTSRSFMTAAAMAVLLATGCASDDQGARKAQPESAGFVWAGQGEPSNFGMDQNFCSRNVGVTRAPLGSQGVEGSIDAMSTQRNTALGSDYAAKRRFWQCMQSRGWELTGG
ncbi:MAG: hypothetical protein JNM75_03575 [Rhodospirillales bacterium]|nr:hypothetical protein [Rhodospirillales bacterium]